MSLKDMMNKVAKQIEETPIKEKVIQWKDKTMDMVKGVDNPAHYQKLPGFRLFQTPISVNLNDREKILVEQIGKLEEPNTRDCAIRLASILPETEQIKNIIVATMKLPYLIVWTEQDMIIIVCKEHYRRLAREEIHTFKLTQTSPSGLSFLINEWEFTGTDKSRTYTLIRNFCHENTFDYKFQSYDAPVTDFNFVERFKYAKLKKENEAELENKILVKLMETSELPIVSVYGTYEKKSCIIMLSTKGFIYFISGNIYTIIDKKYIQKLERMNRGVFSSEFYMDNYYFINAGVEHTIDKLLQYCHEETAYEEARVQLQKENEILSLFPFQEATMYTTPAQDGIIIANNKKQFVIYKGFDRMKLYQAEDYLKYNCFRIKSVKETGLSETHERDASRVDLTKEDVSTYFDEAEIEIYSKKEEIEIFKAPLSLVKKVNLKTYIETKPSVETIYDLLEQLEQLSESSNK